MTTHRTSTEATLIYGEDVWLTEQQVAAMLQCSTRYVMDLRLKGEGPRHFKRGRFIRYRQGDVVAFLRGDQP